MFEKDLLSIKSKLSYRNRDRKELSKLYISKRLNKTIISYKHELESNINYLINRKPENVLKRM
jgi:hypothetical protein